jgi:hypothetical protein
MAKLGPMGFRINGRAEKELPSHKEPARGGGRSLSFRAIGLQPPSPAMTEGPDRTVKEKGG